MGLSVANILLEVTGDSSSAQRELGDVARSLALFGREEAEAAAYIDTTEATVELDELKAKLAEFSADDYSAEVNLRIAKAQADIAVLQAELEKVDGEDVTVDIDVKRGIVERFGALSRQIEQLGKDAEQVGQGALSSFASRLKSAWSEASIFGVSLTKIAALAPVVIAALVAVIGQLLAIVASAANAAGGIGALAVAFGATLVPGILLAVGAIAKFKKDSETAGTAAYALAGNLKDVWNTFQNATAGGANAVFQGLSDALRNLDPVIQSLTPAFKRLGEAGGDAFRIIGAHFSSPAWRKFFVFTTDSLAKLTPLFARSFGAFADILRNIATAAMPFLIQGFRLLAKGLEAIAGKTSDIKDLRDGIGGMVDSLKAWGHLLGGVVQLTGAFVAALAPIGDSIVASLGDGAENLAKWLRSDEGLRKVQQFFEQTGPLAAELGKLVLNVGLALIQIGELVAPALTPVVHLFNQLFEAINKALSYVNDHAPGVLKVLAAVIAPVTVLGDAFRAVKGTAEDAFGVIKDVVGKIASLVSTPISFVLDFASDIASRARDHWDAVKSIVTDTIKFVLQFASDIASRARGIWHDVKGVVTDTIKFVIHFADDLARRARGIWGDVKGVITDAIHFVMSLPGDLASRARNVWNDVKGVIKDSIEFVLGLPGDIVGRARDLWNKVKDALSGAIDLVVKIVPDLSGLPGKVVDALGFANGVEDLRESMFAMVGERGPELAFLPQGTDIYTAGETRNILKALSKGVGLSAAAPAAAGAAPGGRQVVNNYDVTIAAPSSGYADPEIALALFSSKLRARGALG